MKKLLFILLASFTMNAFSATLTKKLVCENTSLIVEALMTKFGEKVIFAGDGTEDDQGTKIILFMNKDSGSWTVIQMKNDVACFLANGDSAMMNK